MPAKRNRIQVLLPDDVYEAIATIARLSNMSQSGFIAQILKTEKKTLIQLSHLMLEAQEAKEKLSLTGKLRIDQHIMDAGKHKDAAIANFERIHLIISDANNSEAATGDGRSRPGPGPQDPLAINKGAKTVSEGGKRPKMSKQWQDI